MGRAARCVSSWGRCWRQTCRPLGPTFSVMMTVRLEVGRGSTAVHLRCHTAVAGLVSDFCSA
eukprot:1273225-Rhodomonas_salina.1